MDGLGDEQALLAKARAAGSPSSELNHRIEVQRNRISRRHSANGTSTGSVKLSWREAAKSIKLSPRNAHPKIHDFERSVLPSLRTLRAQFVCGLCPNCSRPLIESILPQHIAECKERTLKKHELLEENKSDSKSNSLSSGLKREDSESTGAVNKKKRKLVEEGINGGRTSNEGSNEDNDTNAKRAKTTAKAKSKTSKKPKTTKSARAPKPPKPPKQAKEKPVAVYHPDKNCGVPLPNGQPCMRSLTCKQHSMGSKRSVPGRSTSYDILLGNYHRQHQMKQAQLSASAAQAAQMESDQLQEAQAQQNPEREVHQVLEGVSRAFCPPLAVGKVTSSYSRASNFRLREMLAVALLPRRLPPTGDVLYGRSLAFNPETPEQLMYVRSQAVQQALYISQMQQRQLQLRRQAETGTQLNNAQQPSTLATQRELQNQRIQYQQQQQLNARMNAQQQLQQRMKKNQHKNPE